MHILIFDIGSYTLADLKEAFLQKGHQIKIVSYHFTNRLQDDFFSIRFSEIVRENSYDCIFSINFFPLVARIAAEENIPYISWTYDSPLSQSMEPYFHFDTNHIFLFDSYEMKALQKKGFTNVYYLPLAVNTKRLINQCITKYDYQRHSCDISFVGKLYESNIDPLLYPLTPWQKGYIMGAIDSQMLIYGDNIISQIISDDILDQINQNYNNAKLDRKGLCFALQKHITYAERTTLLETFGSLCHTNYYATESYPFQSAVNYMGPVKYHTEMPAVFKCSKLNLCPTLRSIISGIPLRCLDILGCGGVLLVNYQPDLLEYFVDGEDLITYHSPDDAIERALWYLNHEESRKKIQGHALPLLEKEFSFSKKLTELFDCIPDSNLSY